MKFLFSRIKTECSQRCHPEWSEAKSKDQFSLSEKKSDELSPRQARDGRSAVKNPRASSRTSVVAVTGSATVRRRACADYLGNQSRSKFRRIRPKKLNQLSWIFLIILGLFFILPAALRAAEPDADFDAANRAYTEGRYEDSAKLFQQLIAARGYSAPLCFNLGNAEAKAGHPGLAILNYERARYLAPADSDIDHNLQLARKQAGLEPNSYRWWEIVLRLIYPVIGYLVMACLLLFILALIGNVYASVLAPACKIPQPVLRKVLKGVFFVSIPVFLLLCFAELSAIGFTNRIEGIIVTPKEATLRLSPFESADRTGTIPEGELVTVEQRHDDYFRIEGRDHHYGWIQEKELEPIIAGSFDKKAPE
jgi:tetratricopeptide (TPR) repeat protein